MNARTEERVDGWTSRSFTGGHDGLRDLAADEFSGVVELDDGPWLCMLNGKVIGVFDGRIEDFKGATGTTYIAPDPAVPLLFAMEERGGTLEEQYYTKDTPISEADTTLSSGSFVGYVELSENVLSGDYYICYYGGRSLPVGFVGNTDQLVTGDEAFEKADDEVGIYDVFSVDMDVTEIPDEPEPDPDRDRSLTTEEGGVGTAGRSETRSPSETSGIRDDEGGIDASDPAVDSGDNEFAARRDRNSEPGAAGDIDAGELDDPPDSPSVHSDDREPGGSVSSEPRDPEPTDGEAETRRDRVQPQREPDVDKQDRREDIGAGGAGGNEYDERQTNAETRPADTPADRPDTGTDPGISDAVDSHEPDMSPRKEDPREAAGAVDGQNQTGKRQFERDPIGGDDWDQEVATPSDPQTDVPSTEDSRPGSKGPDSGADAAKAFEELRNQVADHDRTIEILKGQLSAAKREHEQFEDEHDHQASHVEALRETVGKLESDLQDLYRRVDRFDNRLSTLDRIERRVEELSGAGDVGDTRSPHATDDSTTPSPRPDHGAERETSPDGDNLTPDRGDGAVDLSPAEALRQTNLLVRYDSKGKPTLESAHRGEADAADVNPNLRLDTHTSFREHDATVDGRPFEEFLTDRIEFEFAEWLVRDLPYEIRDTGKTDALGDLYDALPAIDRIEMNTGVTVSDEDEDVASETVEFDLVVRDKSGRPLVVTNFNDSRDPATKGMVVDLEGGASTIRGATDLRAAMLVTTSFFDPEALETVDQVTGGSLLSRDSKKSYVKLSRKRGYHLCLVESRDGDFHVNVPEL